MELRQLQLLPLQSEVNAEVGRLDAGLDAITRAREMAVSRLFEADSPPL